MKELIAPDDFCTMREAARELRVSVPTVSRWIHSGRLPAVRIGPRSIRIRRADIGRVASAVRSGSDPGRVERAKQADELIARLKRLHEEQRARHGVFESSVPIIREAREEWGKDI